jgi:hypothetical protein
LNKSESERRVHIDKSQPEQGANGPCFNAKNGI